MIGGALPVEAKEGSMTKFLKRLAGDEVGVTALEYALIAALIAVVIIGSVSLLGTSVSQTFSTVANTI
jgi:pilus assembly protein Flp/PilA